MYYTSQTNPSAWIVDSRDRGRKKIYLNSKIYLDNNQEFLIELFNPLQDSVLAEIKINGKIASATGLILRPGERFYLDCFVDDRKKFIFKTYEIENTTESLNATANNGYVEVTFYKEKTYTNIFSGICGTTTTIGNNSIWLTNSGTSVNTSLSNCSYTSGIDLNNNLNTRSFSNSKTKLSKSINKTETGRVEKGDSSNQKFESISMNFENYCINKISYQLLPNSKKPIETSEIKRNFCSDCGNKLKGTERFCPSCGTRI